MVGQCIGVNFKRVADYDYKNLNKKRTDDKFWSALVTPKDYPNARCLCHIKSSTEAAKYSWEKFHVYKYFDFCFLYEVYEPAKRVLSKRKFYKN